MLVDDYLALTTSEHREQPLFQAFLGALLSGPVDGINVTLSLPEDFNLDTAVGAQLDAIGLWIGLGRQVNVAITGVYFTWADLIATGWGHGFWKGPFDPSTGIVMLDDASYRAALIAKIEANHWDGTLEAMCLFYDHTFGAAAITVTDNMNMTITVTYTITALNAVQTSMLLNGSFFMKPMGVSIIYVGV